MTVESLTKKSVQTPAPKSRDVASIVETPELLAHVDAIRLLGKQTVESVIEIGRHLTECKRIIGHGGWLPWLKREFAWHENTALNYMRVFEMSKSTTVVDLSLPIKSLYLLAAPSTSEAARAEIIERAEKGEKVKDEDVKSAIRAARPAKKATKLRPTAPSKTAPAPAATAAQAMPAVDPWADLDLPDYLRRSANGVSPSIAAVSNANELDALRERVRELGRKLGAAESEIVDLKTENERLRAEIAKLRAGAVAS